MFFPKLLTTITNLAGEFDAIPDARKQLLRQISSFVRERQHSEGPVALTYICTHNSRRSHLAQIWAQAAAAFYHVPQVQTYSGGTEATAFFPSAVMALEGLGFMIVQTTKADNPIYHVRFDSESPAMTAFSKIYSDAPNPRDGYAAVMTCTSADEACPLVNGATVRIALPYDDPKVSDNTPQQTATYSARAREIGREMLYAFSEVTS